MASNILHPILQFGAEDADGRKPLVNHFYPSRDNGHGGAANLSFRE